MQIEGPKFVCMHVDARARYSCQLVHFATDFFTVLYQDDDSKHVWVLSCQNTGHGHSN